MPFQPPYHRPPGWQPPHIRARAYDQARAAENRVIYGTDWQKVRKAFIAAYPFCCADGCTKRTEQVDHILSVRERPDLRLTWSNLRPLCHSHHSSRTSRDQGWGRAKREEAADR